MQAASVLVVLTVFGCGTQRAPVAKEEPPRLRHPAERTPLTREEPPRPQLAAVTPARWCTLRLSSTGIYVDGDRISQSDAVTTCNQRAGAVVVLEDTAPADTWSQLEAELRRERVEIQMRGLLDDNACTGNPLAKGCM